MKFKVGDKVRNIITGNVGTVKSIEKKCLKDKFVEEVDKRLGRFNKIYYVAYPKGFACWQNIVEIEKVEEILDEKEKEYLSNVIKPFKNQVIDITKIQCLGMMQYLKIVYKENNYGHAFAQLNFPLFKERKNV